MKHTWPTSFLQAKTLLFYHMDPYGTNLQKSWKLFPPLTKTYQLSLMSHVTQARLPLEQAAGQLQTQLEELSHGLGH